MDSLSSQYSLKPPVGDKTPTRWKNEGWEWALPLYINIWTTCTVQNRIWL